MKIRCWIPKNPKYPDAATKFTSGITKKMTVPNNKQSPSFLYLSLDSKGLGNAFFRALTLVSAVDDIADGGVGDA